MTKSKLTIKVAADTKEALEGIKEVTEAANECVEALEKLEKVMGKFNKKGDSIEIKVGDTVKGMIQDLGSHTSITANDVAESLLQMKQTAMLMK
ncbi:hypothetical protein [Bacillus thuringiensis]|uniref:hypothetical protein n=1 Tax=Bacillus thuringiensis TaxID=1428 RepID=UPI0026E15BC0|nr:hypothetical protein [Bacillus thuringiensis]MDO6631778.1 hypothetical protein [Bacillus thuringiensis]MDO6661391.1 hypothetical protein [Bacillus thuringiensis]MDO6701918.1 hypothetical protein [Bacillus thuringiensis]